VCVHVQRVKVGTVALQQLFQVLPLLPDKLLVVFFVQFIHLARVSIAFQSRGIIMAEIDNCHVLVEKAKIAEQAERFEDMARVSVRQRGRTEQLKF